MVVNYYVDQNYTFALATDAVSLSWPWASAGFLVEYQAIGAGDQIGLSSRAEEELVTDGRIAVLEVTVGSGAVGGGVSGLCVNIWIINKFKEKKKERENLKLTELGTAGAVDVEREVAPSGESVGQIGKDQTIGAEFLRQHEIVALVVAVALDAVGENAVLLRAITLGILSVY